MMVPETGKAYPIPKPLYLPGVLKEIRPSAAIVSAGLLYLVAFVSLASLLWKTLVKNQTRDAVHR